MSASGRGAHRAAGPPRDPLGLAYQPSFVGEADRREILAWLGGLAPLWEQRYSTVRPLPPGQSQRALLRPVYWLGNWQFACLGYYEPPRKTRDRAVRAEPFPPVLARLVASIEARVRREFRPADVPPGWALNTCLVNFYGARGGEDVARVGEHRDREPGPVASVSLGERALFQFVRRGSESGPVKTMWLDDGSLQVFAGPVWKDGLLHRVQRVEDKRDLDLPPVIPGFRTRRVNFTFRFVPDRDVVAFADLGDRAAEDVRGYVTQLAARSAHWRRALDARPPGGGASDDG